MSINELNQDDDHAVPGLGDTGPPVAAEHVRRAVRGRIEALERAQEAGLHDDWATLERERLVDLILELVDLAVLADRRQEHQLAAWASSGARLPSA